LKTVCSATSAGACDLRDRDPLEPALAEQPPRGLRDELPRLLLLALA
jgi:hypothetical protein